LNKLDEMMIMKKVPCSPNERTKGMVWFPRMLDKIRLHARGELPDDYVPWLGKGFDGRCIRYLRADYAALVARVLQGGSNEEILEWCFKQGRELSEEDIGIWSDFLRKRGWRDSAEVLADLEESKRQSGLGDRTDLDTYFRYNDADEGREIA
jgi:gluconokinase